MLLRSNKVTQPNLDNSSARTRPLSRSQVVSSSGRSFTRTRNFSDSNLYNLALQIQANGTHLKFIFLKSNIKKIKLVPKKQPLNPKKAIISKWQQDKWNGLSPKKEMAVRFLNENGGELKKTFKDAGIAFEFIKKYGSLFEILNFDGILEEEFNLNTYPLFRACDNLKNLILKNSNFEIEDFLHIEESKTIRTLNLENSGIEREEIKVLLKKLKNLQELVLNGIDMTPKHIKNLSSAKRKLKILSLVNCKLTPDSLNQILKGQNQLEQLTVSKKEIPSEEGLTLIPELKVTFFDSIT